MKNSNRKPIPAYLRPEKKAALDELARQLDRSRAALIREALDALLRRYTQLERH